MYPPYIPFLSLSYRYISHIRENTQISNEKPNHPVEYKTLTLTYTGINTQLIKIL